MRRHRKARSLLAARRCLQQAKGTDGHWGGQLIPGRGQGGCHRLAPEAAMIRIAISVEASEAVFSP
jgi:hypothetical protein